MSSNVAISSLEYIKQWNWPALAGMSNVLFFLYRKKLNKGVLLYVHLNLSLALLASLVLFVAGIETAVHIKVSLLIEIASVLAYTCTYHNIRIACIEIMKE